MAQNKVSKAVERELEDYKKVENPNTSEFFKKSNLKKKYKIVLFQVPKDVINFLALTNNFSSTSQHLKARK